MARETLIQGQTLSPSPSLPRCGSCLLLLPITLSCSRPDRAELRVTREDAHRQQSLTEARALPAEPLGWSPLSLSLRLQATGAEHPNICPGESGQSQA